MSRLPDNSNRPVANRPETMIALVVTFGSLSTIAVCLRLFVRYRERLCGWDDLLILMSALSCIAGSTIPCIMTQHGLGKHFYTLDAHTKINYFKYVWISNLLYCVGTTFIKLSILAQYLRLFKNNSTRARKVTLVTLVFVVMWGLSFFFLSLFSCTPIAKNWKFNMPGRCVGWGSKNADDFFAMWVAHGSSNMCVDAVILALPVPFIRSLKMNRKTRTGLITLLVLGGLAVIFSIARTVALTIHRVGTTPVFDVSWYTPMVYIFSVLELNMAILTASIPIFWPLVTKLAANRILIVNEIEIRTERRSAVHAYAHAPFALAAQGRRFGTSPEAKSDPHSHNNHNHHHHAATSAGPSRGASLDDAKTEFELVHHASSSSGGISAATSDADDLSRSTSARYADPLVHEWAVPDFDGEGGAKNKEGRFVTSVQRAEVPYDHIRKACMS